MGGMGLFLSKDLIESKMGSIKLNSVFKEGTTVSVTIPYTPHGAEIVETSSQTSSQMS